MKNIFKRIGLPLVIAAKMAATTPSIANTPGVGNIYSNVQKIVTTAASYAGKGMEIAGKYSFDPKQIGAYTALESIRAFNIAEAFNASAYTLAADECGKGKDDPWYGITASLTPAKVGVTIAAAPEHKGKIVYIEELDPASEKFNKWKPELQKYFIEHNFNGYFRADDVGGAITGNKIDVFISEDNQEIARQFGRRQLTGYMIDDVEELVESVKIDNLAKLIGPDSYAVMADEGSLHRYTDAFLDADKLPAILDKELKYN